MFSPWSCWVSCCKSLLAPDKIYAPETNRQLNSQRLQQSLQWYFNYQELDLSRYYKEYYSILFIHLERHQFSASKWYFQCPSFCTSWPVYTKNPLSALYCENCFFTFKPWQSIKNAVLQGLKYCFMENFTFFMYILRCTNFVPIILYAQKLHLYSRCIVKNEYQVSTANAVFCGLKSLPVQICTFFSPFKTSY